MKPGRDNPFRRHIQQALAKQSTSPAPPTVDLLLQQARAHHAAGQLPQAEALYRQTLEASPKHPVALHLLGVIACQVGQHALALELIDLAIQADPNSAEAHCSRGDALYLTQQYQDALASYDRALLLNPRNAEIFNNRGSTLHALQQYQAAVDSYDQAVKLNPDYAEAWSNRANTLYILKQYHASLDSSDRAIALRPDYAEAHSNRGNALHALHQYHAALESCDQAILLAPDYADAHFIRGNLLQTLKQHQAAVECYDRVLLLNPRHPEAHNNRGSALHVLNQRDAALDNFDHAIQLKPDYAEAHHNRGVVLHDLKQYHAAIDSYDKALQLRPGYEYLPGMRLHMKRILCDWENSDSECRQLEAAIERGEKAALPFTVLAVSSSAAIQKMAAEIHVRDKFSAQPAPPPIPRRPRRDRIRIGYFSGDFYNHAVSYLMGEVFERHDRSRFEILGFSFSPDPTDEMGQRVAAAMDRFFNVRAMPDQSIAQLSRELEVDIAVDLTGFTHAGRAGIFAARAAPIQVNYLGYPGTMGATFIDYLIADRTVIPEASQQHYSEKIVCLPDTFQANDSQRPVCPTTGTRADEGLPESAFVFCSFNSAYKITPAVFDVWMRILGRVDGSVLWLRKDNPWAVENLRKEAARRGVDPDRLVFTRPLALAQHLARQRLADLSLDTSPYGAHTTTSDALWAGLPVVTCIGETFASRVAASLLRAIDLPELVTATEAEFEELAVALALDSDRDLELRHRLQQNQRAAPLFNTPAFLHHLEAAYSAIFDRYHADLPPDHIQIDRLPG